MGQFLFKIFPKENSVLLLRRWLFCFSILCITLHLPSSTAAMDDEEFNEASSLSPKQPKGYDSHLNTVSSIEDGDIEIDSDSPMIIEESDARFSRSIPIINIDRQNRKRNALNRLLYQLSNKPKLMKKLGDEGIHDTAVIVYDLSKQPLQDESSPPAWTKTGPFLQELDERFFKANASTPKKIFYGLATIPDLYYAIFGPGGPIATTWYLWGDSNIFHLVNVGPLVGIITWGTHFSLIPVFLMQAAECTENLGDVLFGDKQLTPSKSDAKPHIQKLGTEVETGCTRCCKSIRIPTPVVYAFLSLVDAGIVTLPYFFFFREAELDQDIPNGEIFFYRNVIPLVAFYLQKTFRENYDFFINQEYKRKSAEIRMVRQKKDILRRRLKTMGWHVNSPGSDNLVNQLYKVIQDELQNSDKKTDGERVSAFSLLFLKLARHTSYADIHRELNLQVVGDEDIQELIGAASTIPAQEMANLITDIDKLPSETNMSKFLKQAATWTKGLSTIGELIVINYGLQQLLQPLALALGLDPTVADNISYVASIAHGLFSAFTQSDVQEQAFLRTRHFGSTYTDLWPLRWGVNVLSAATALFLTVPYPCIINEVLGENVPPYLRFFLALSTVPNQLTSFYNFCHIKYAHLITAMATNMPIKTTKQKRAWINRFLERGAALVDKLDQSTTEQWYNLCQEGL